MPRVLAAVLALVGVLLAAPAVSAQDPGSEDAIVVRSVDGRDPDNVVVEFFYDGPRNNVPDLVIREDGRVIDSTTPIRLDDEGQFGIVLAIDTSGSMGENGAFERAKDAAKAFIANKEPDDQIAIVGFDRTVQVAQRFTADAETLNEAVDRLGIAAGTSLYDAVRDSVNLFEGTDLVPNIVIVTDGGDVSSTTSADVARSLLDEANALLFAIGVESDGLDVAGLEALAEGTGGSVLTSADPGGLADLYEEVQAQIRRQYRTTMVSERQAEGPAALTLTIGNDTTQASYTPGARLDQASQVEPVVISDRGGVDALQSDVFLYVAIILVLVAVAAAVWAVVSTLTTDRRTLSRVLQPYSDGFVASDEGDGDRLATSAILQRAVELTGDFAARRGLLARAEDMLERANLPLRAAEAIFFWLACALVVSVLGGVLAGTLAAFVFVLIFALLIPPAVISFLAARRRREFHAQLPDMLALLASTLRSGYSLMQGVEAAAQEVTDPMQRELQRVVTESRLGMPLEQALENVATRFNSKDFAWATMAIGIQREVGGNLAELLDTVADTMTQRERLRRDIKALTAEGRVSAMVLGFLPFGIGAAITVLNPGYLNGLFDETLGLIMLGGALGLMLVGFWWMFRIIDIDV